MDTQLKPPQDVEGRDLPIIATDLPVMYEDEGQEEMGETETHYDSIAILRYGLKAHLADHSQYRVFSDLNLYYHPLDLYAYISPDVMAVAPGRELGEQVTSYRLNKDGPGPVFTAEVLSRRSHQQQDTTNKPQICADMGVAEYVLIDVTAEFLPQRLMLKRLQSDRQWLDEQDNDGGVTSNLGFRLVIEEDSRLRVINAKTGERYARPDEAEFHRQALKQAEQRRTTAEQQRLEAEQRQREEAEARRQAEKELEALRVELEKLRGEQPDA